MQAQDTPRYVVTVSRFDFDEDALSTSVEVVVVGPFKMRRTAEDRALVIRRLAERYEDPEGVTGPDNALSVVVEPLQAGPSSAQTVLDVLYGSMASGRFPR